MVNESRGIQSVERAMSILEVIAAAGGEARLTDLVESLGLHKSTLHGLLNTLCAMGYISRRGTLYALGLRLREVAQPLSDSDLVLREEFSPVLEAMAKLTGENCYLAAPCGTRHYIYLDMIEVVPGTSRVPRGRREALTTSAMGKVFLALDGELTRSLRKAGLVDAQLEDEIKSIIERGFALDLQQAEAGLNCMALPLRKKGRMVAAISVAAPSDRLTANQLELIANGMMRDLYDIIKL